jgi:glycogen synthase
VSTVLSALSARKHDQDRWLKIRQNAEAARFSWQAAANRYRGDLYEIGND